MLLDIYHVQEGLTCSKDRNSTQSQINLFLGLIFFFFFIQFECHVDKFLTITPCPVTEYV